MWRRRAVCEYDQRAHSGNRSRRGSPSSHSKKPMENAMDLFTREHLNHLLDVHADPCLSIYIPTHRSAPATAQDRIRFKNMLQQAKQELEERGFNQPAIREPLGPAEDWLNDSEFWRYQSDGLAAFLTESTHIRFRVSRAFQEQLRVADHFYVNPLLPLIQSNERFYLLAVSQNSCRLFAGCRDRIQVVEEADLPTDLQSALGRDRESELNLHSMQRRPASRGGDNTAIFHGHEEETQDIDLEAYFRMVDAGLMDVLRGECAPLIFAGVDYLLPIYEGINSYRGLSKEAVTGNPDDIPIEELHRQAWGIVRPIVESRQRQAISEYMQRSSQGTAIDGIAMVLTAARDGLVETLIIPRDSSLPGHFDAKSGNVEFKPDRNTEDLLDQATVWTLRNSGEVLAVEPKLMPNESRLLALLRAPRSAVVVSRQLKRPANR